VENKQQASNDKKARLTLFGGTEVAVTKKLIQQGRIPRDESIVISVTGNGYKTLGAVARSVEKPFSIQGSLQASTNFTFNSPSHLPAKPQPAKAKSQSY